MAKTNSINRGTQALPIVSVPLWQRPGFFKWLAFLFPAILFINSIPNNYSLDDELVTINHRLTSKGISAIPEIFSSPYYQDESGYSFEYRPVVLTSFAIEHQLFGDNPHVSHFFNVILYALSCLILYNVLRKLLKRYSPFVAIAISLLYAAHPAHTEVVCSIKNRDEILGLLFSLLTLSCVIRYLQRSKPWALVLVPILFGFALMSKITVVSFVIIIPLILILLVDAKLITTLVVTVLLLIPTYFLLTFTSAFDKLVLCLAVVLGVLSLYSLCHRGLVRVQIEEAIKKVQGIKLEAFLGESFDIVLRPAKEFFKGTVPGKEIFSLPALLLALVLVITYAAGVINHHSFWVTPVIILLFVLSCSNNHKFSFWAAIALNICFAFDLAISMRADTGENSLYREVILLFLLFQLFFRSRIYTIPAILMIAVNFYLNVALLPVRNEFFWEYISYEWGFLFCFFFFLFSKRINNIFFLFILFGVLYYSAIQSVVEMIPSAIIIAFYAPFYTVSKRKLSPFLAVFVTLFFGRLGMVLRPGLPWAPTLIITGIVGYYLVYRQKYPDRIVSVISAFVLKGRKYLPWIYVLFAISLFHIKAVHIDTAFNINSQIQDVKVFANDNFKTTIVETKTNRELNFVEEVVNHNDPTSVKLGTSLEILFYYLQKAIIPYPLSFYYGYKFIRPEKLSDTIPIISLILYLVLLVLALLLLKRAPLISLGALIYIVSILIFANYLTPVAGMIADRYLLVPSLGWIMIFVALLSVRIKESKKVQFTDIPLYSKYCFMAVLVLYSALTFSRNMDWKDYITLFRHDIQYADNSSQAHNLLATRLMKVSYLTNDPTEQLALRREGLDHFKKALEIYPDFFNVAFDIGKSYALLNMPDSAVLAFDKAIKLNPNYSQSYLNAGDILFQQRKFEQSIPYFEALISKYPDRYFSYDRLSYIYFSQKKYDLAKDVSMKAIRNTPQSALPYIALGRIYHGLNDMDSSRIFLQKAIEIAPDNKDAQILMQDLKK